MLAYTVHRIFIMVPTLLAISAIIFTIIQLPPGDYLETYMEQLRMDGGTIDMQKIEQLRQRDPSLNRLIHKLTDRFN